MDPPAHIAVTADRVTLLIHQAHGASLYLKRYEVPANTMSAAWREMVQLPNMATLLQRFPVGITADTIMTHLQQLQQHRPTSDITKALEMFLPRALLYYMYIKITGSPVMHKIFKAVVPAIPHGDGHSTIHDDVLTVVSEYCDPETAFRLHIAHPLVVLPEYHILAGLYNKVFLEQCLRDYRTWSPLLFSMMTKLVDEYIIKRNDHDFECKSWPVLWLELLLKKVIRIDPYDQTSSYINPELHAYLGPYMDSLERWPHTLAWQDMFQACDNVDYLYQYTTPGFTEIKGLYCDYMKALFPFPEPDDDNINMTNLNINMMNLNVLGPLGVAFRTGFFNIADSVLSHDEMVQQYGDVVARYHWCDVHDTNPCTDADIMARYQQWRQDVTNDFERVMAKITTQALEQHDTLSDGIIVYTDMGAYRYWSGLWWPCCWYVSCKVQNVLSVKRGSLNRNLILIHSVDLDKSITVADALAVVRYHML